MWPSCCSSPPSCPHEGARRPWQTLPIAHPGACPTPDRPGAVTRDRPDTPLATPLPRADRRLSHMVAARAGSPRLRIVGEWHLPAAQPRPRDGRAAADHPRARRARLGRDQCRWAVGPLASGHDRGRSREPGSRRRSSAARRSRSPRAFRQAGTAAWPRDEPGPWPASRIATGSPCTSRSSTGRPAGCGAPRINPPRRQQLDGRRWNGCGGPERRRDARHGRARGAR